jgi:hypothetical protein
MSFIQWLGNIGAAAPADITREMFAEVIRYIGHTFDLYVRRDIIDCPNFSNTYKTCDRGCIECGGTGSVGGYNKQEDHTFLGAFQPWPEQRQDQHQRLFAKSGPVDTFDGQIFTESKWFDIIHLEDLLVWKPKGSSDGYELKIISKMPRFGLDNNIMFTRLDVTRNPYPIRVGATDLRKSF